MKKHIIVSLRMLLVMTVLTGVIYPVVMTLFAGTVFPHQANGSLSSKDNVIVGSELLAQNFQSDKYFWPRPSAGAFETVPSSASNYGPTSDTLKKLVDIRRAQFIKANGLPGTTEVPKDMLFASGSGLDPEISPEAAGLQLNRVARARGFDAAKTQQLREVVANHTRGAQFGLFGEPRVNVLQLNLSLDELQ
jgi:K+-transporting ATPase ATPase C chain